MEYGLISHRSALNECYALNETELEISIRTGYDVTRVFLCYGDPFSAGIMGGEERWSGEKEEITEYKNLSLVRIWSITVKPKYKRCKYYFELWSGEEKVYYFEDGVYTRERMELPGRKEQCFFFPWMNPSDINVTPRWVEEAVWYQIFPDRFCNGDSSLNSGNVKPWKCEKVGRLDVYGGDLRGICGKLPYLKELGITGIYLTPIFASVSNHKYDTTDYYRIDENFGDEQEFIALVREAHEAGIHIIMDAVFNHCGQKFAPWQDVMEKGRGSDYFDWFFIHQFPFDRRDYDTHDGKYDSFAFHGQMPKLNTNNPKVVEYFKNLCLYWVKNWGIDGIRFDVGNEVSHSFLKELRRSLKAVKPDIYLLGEIWHDSIGWLMGDEYDSVMNYPLEQSLNDFYIDENQSSVDFEHEINRCYSLYMKQTNRVLFNLLDSHDTERLSMRTKTKGRFYQQLAVLFTMEGSPCIYYGTEIYMQGGYDPDCRRCMPWEEIEAGRYEDDISYMKRLIAMRKENPACKSGRIEWLHETEQSRLVHYVKVSEEGSRIHVVLNATGQCVTLPEKAADANGEKILFAYDYGEAGLGPDGVCIYME